MVATHDSVMEELSQGALLHRIPGGQVAWRRDTDDLLWNYGVRDARDGKPVDSTTPFPVGSLTKPWVAAMATILATDEGIDLDETLDEFFPGTAFSLRHLLSHRAGFPTHLEGPGTTPSEWARFAVRPGVLAEPGRWSAYSSAGIVAAAALIEQLSGMSWFSATREFLAEPLGINIHLARDMKEGVSGHLARNDGGWATIEPITHPLVEDAAGGLALSASGMAAFIAAGLTGTGPFALPDEQRWALVNSHVPVESSVLDPGRRWSAWSLQVVGEQQGGQLILDCFLDGIVANLRCVPHTGEVLTMLTNGDRGDRLWSESKDLLGGEEADRLTGVTEESELPNIDAPASALGSYVDGSELVEIVSDGPNSYVRVEGFTLARMDWHEGGQFTLVHPSRGSLGRGSYHRTDDGEEILFLAGRIARRSE